MDFGPSLVGDEKDQAYLLGLHEEERTQILLLRFNQYQAHLRTVAQLSSADTTDEITTPTKAATPTKKASAKKRRGKEPGPGSGSKRQKGRAAVTLHSLLASLQTAAASTTTSFALT